MPLHVSCPGPLLRSACLGGGRSGPGSPLPGLGLCAPRGAGPWRSCAGGWVSGGGGGRCAVPPICAAGGASRGGGRSASSRPSAFSVRRPGALARARLTPAVPVGASGWGGGAGRAPAPLSGGGRGDHPPCLGGWGTAPPPERGAGARPAPPPQPPAPTGTAGNKRARANAPGRRTDRARRSRASTNRSGMGTTPPMTRMMPVTPALLPAQKRQRDGTRQSDPPPYSLVPRGSCGSWRLGRGGGPCSGSSLGRGEGGPPPLPRGVEDGAPAACGPVGGVGGGVAPRSPCPPLWGAARGSLPWPCIPCIFSIFGILALFGAEETNQ